MRTRCRGTGVRVERGVVAGVGEWAGVMYLFANVAAILVGGVYRFVLDAQWTWG